MADDDNIPSISETYTGGPLAGGEDIGSGREALEQASQELEQSRSLPAVEREPEIVDYRGSDGEVDPDRSPISLRRAASDLGRYRSQRVIDAEERAIDSIRRGESEAPRPQTARSATAPVSTEPQYAPQVQGELPAPGGGSYAFPSREQILASWPQIQTYHKNNSELLVQLEAKTGEEASAGRDLTDLYQHRANTLQHIQHAEYLARIAQAVNGGMDPKLAIPLSDATVQQGLQNIIARYEAQYSQAIKFALTTAENAHTHAQASLYAFFPELRASAPSYQDLHKILAGIKSQNPRRAAAIEFSLARNKKHTTRCALCSGIRKQDTNSNARPM
jgi:hypothetical protein